MGWSPRFDFETAIEQTIRWYVDNEAWWRSIREKQAEYREFEKKWYAERS
jgi:dTDP-glucose 4,6-dehydratase